MIDKQVIARLSSHKHKFEILVNADKAQLFKEGKMQDIREVLVTDGVFKDIRNTKIRNKVLMMDDKKSAERVDEKDLLEVFGTTDTIKISEQILRNGEIQYTTEQTREFLKQKRNRIINLISKEGIDPRTNTPHTSERISNAMDQAKIKIDLHKPAEAQVKEIVQKINIYLPISIEKKRVLLKIPINVAGNAKSIVSNMSTIIKENWIGDKWIVTIEISAGLQDKLFSQLNSLTHGEVESQVI